MKWYFMVAGLAIIAVFVAIVEVGVLQRTMSIATGN